MKRKIRSICKTILSVALFWVLACPIANATKPSLPKPNTKEAYLMVQAAHTADIIHDKKTNTNTVILKNVAPFVAYFSDRPDRKAGSMPIHEFLKLWEQKGKNSFGVNPPNADLHATQLLSSSEAVNFSVELTNPVYNAKNKTLSYTVSSLEGAAALPHSAEVQNVLLFIDDVCISCW